MKLPTAASYLKAIIITLVVTVVALILFPLFGLAEENQTVFLTAIGSGALIGAVLSATRFSGAATEAGEEELKSIFVGNLAFKASQDELRELFSPYGKVHSVRIMSDRVTRRPRGFGFVEMSPREANKAIKSLDGTDFLGRKLRVNEGNERRPKETKTAA